MEPSEARGRVMGMAMGAWVCQAIASLTRLNVPDVLEREGASSARELSERHGVDALPEFLERLLRACASVGVLTEDEQGRFGPTPLSRVLTLDSPASVKHFVELYGGDWWELFGALPDALRSGQPQSKARLGREPWGEDPDAGEAFGEAMRSRPEPLRGLLEHCDLSAARALVDVGGGFGHVAIGLLKRYPELHASVVDLPAVVPIAERNVAGEAPSLRARLSFVAQDMFEQVPPGDTYVVSGVVHDWDDERARRVLANCAARIQPGGRVFCVDAVLPPMGDTGAVSSKFLDLLMMVSLPGRERTEVQWRGLVRSAGLEVAAIHPISGSELSIVETRRGGTPP